MKVRMTDIVVEAHAVQSIGARSRQEDAVVAHFPCGDEFGFGILSDGMGGHEDGDLAARILAGEMFGELFISAARQGLMQDNAGTLLTAALGSANRKLRDHIEAGHISKDTGGTMLSVMVFRDQLRWISVGDSPLYLWRDGALRRLNEDHSMAPQIDMMVARGAIGVAEAETHPDRSCLTSAMTGRPIPRIDCPPEPFRLAAGDILILASDGIETLPSYEIAEVAEAHRHRTSATLAQALLAAVEARALPDQDNTSLAVIRMTGRSETASGLIRRMTLGLGGRLTGRKSP